MKKQTCDVPGCEYAARPGITRCQAHIPFNDASVAYQEAVRGGKPKVAR